MIAKVLNRSTKVCFEEANERSRAGSRSTYSKPIENVSNKDVYPNYAIKKNGMLFNSILPKNFLKIKRKMDDVKSNAYHNLQRKIIGKSELPTNESFKTSLKSIGQIIIINIFKSEEYPNNLNSATFSLVKFSGELKLFTVMHLFHEKIDKEKINTFVLLNMHEIDLLLHFKKFLDREECQTKDPTILRKLQNQVKLHLNIISND